VTATALAFLLVGYLQDPIAHRDRPWTWRSWSSRPAQTQLPCHRPHQEAGWVQVACHRMRHHTVCRLLRTGSCQSRAITREGCMRDTSLTPRHTFRNGVD
jgi:hypothetical protein